MDLLWFRSSLYVEQQCDVWSVYFWMIFDLWKPDVDELYKRSLRKYKVWTKRKFAEDLGEINSKKKGCFPTSSL